MVEITEEVKHAVINEFIIDLASEIEEAREQIEKGFHTSEKDMPEEQCLI